MTEKTIKKIELKYLTEQFFCENKLQEPFIYIIDYINTYSNNNFDNITSNIIHDLFINFINNIDKSIIVSNNKDRYISLLNNYKNKVSIVSYTENNIDKLMNDIKVEQSEYIEETIYLPNKGRNLLILDNIKSSQFNNIQVEHRYIKMPILYISSQTPSGMIRYNMDFVIFNYKYFDNIRIYNYFKKNLIKTDEELSNIINELNNNTAKCLIMNNWSLQYFYY